MLAIVGCQALDGHKRPVVNASLSESRVPSLLCGHLRSMLSIGPFPMQVFSFVLSLRPAGSIGKTCSLACQDKSRMSGRLWEKKRHRGVTSMSQMEDSKMEAK